MRMKEWVLLLLTGVLTVGALSVWARNAKKDEDEKEETKIEQTQDAKLDHSLFETEGTYTTRALAEGDVIGGKWIRVIVENVVPAYVGIFEVEQDHTLINGTCVGFGTMPSDYNLMIGENGSSGTSLSFVGDGFETYKGDTYLDIYIEEGTYELTNGTVTKAFTVDEETSAICFLRGGDSAENDFAYELIPN